MRRPARGLVLRVGSRIWCSILAGALSLVAHDAQAGFRKQELSVPGNVQWVARGDVNGDGATDLVVSYRRGAGPAAARFLGVFFRGPEGYSARPDLAFAAPRNAAAFDVGDVLGDSGDELIYLTASGVWAQSIVDKKPGNPTRIITTPTLVASPEEEDLVHFDFLREPLGLPPTVVVPSRRYLGLFRRDGPVWKEHGKISIDQLSYYDASTSTFRTGPRGGSSGSPYSFRVTTIVPNLDFVEQTGDGRVDLVAHFEDRVAVHPQLEDGTFATKPSSTQWLAVRTREELDSRDSAVDAQVLDLDGDGIADLSITKIGGGVTTLRTEVRLYRGKKGGGFEAEPAQVFKDDGFAALARYVDVDGDGRMEMVHPHSEVSIVSLSRAMLSSKVGLDVRLRRRGEKPQFFDPKPVQVLETSLGLDLTVGAAMRGTSPIFGHDFDGDGRRDVLLSQGGDRMVLHKGRADRSEPFQEDGNITLTAPGSNATEVLLPLRSGGGKPDVLVYFVARKGLSDKVMVFLNEDRR